MSLMLTIFQNTFLGKHPNALRMQVV